MGTEVQKMILDVLDDPSKITVLGCPTFRYGEVCSFIKDLDFETAQAVGVIMKRKWENFFKKIVSTKNDYKIDDIAIDSKSDFFVQIAEGPIYIFPEMDMAFTHQGNKIKCKVRISITVCLDPHHSKVWIRFSYNDDENEVHLPIDKMNAFFSGSEEISSILIPVIKKDIYQAALYAMDINSPLNTIHSINLKCISISKEISHPEYAPIKLDNFEKFDFEHINSSIKSFCFKNNDEEIKKEKKTSIICFVKESTKDRSMSYLLCKEFSKLLVEFIALKI